MQKSFRFAALWLSFVMVLVFAIQQFAPSFTDLFLLRSSDVFYRPWILFTSIFLHSSIAHLLLNLFALALFGLILEKEIGTSGFIVLFFTAGFIGNIASMFFYSNSLGASGAIFGALGMLGVIRPLMPVWFTGFPLPMFLALIVWIGADTLGLFIPSDIANMAHLAGISAGICAGFWFRIKYPEPKNRKRHLNSIEEKELDNYEREAGLR